MPKVRQSNAADADRVIGPDPLRRVAYSVTEAATILGVSRQFLHLEIRRGRLRSTKIGACTRITAAEIERILGRGPDA